MSELNLKAMTQAEMLKYLEEDFMPRLLPKLANIKNLEAENASLKADVERLRESGSSIISILCQHVADYNLRNLALREWNAAKEGKQP